MRSVLGTRGMAAFNRYFGVKPGRDAPKLERLVWFRGYYLKNLPLYVLLLPMLWYYSVWLAALVTLPWVAGFLRLNYEIRRERGRV
jgi:hypothetical protein